MGIITNSMGISYTGYPGGSTTREFSRIISAAVVNQGFRNRLLSNPEEAVASGFNGERFNLQEEDHDLLRSIQAGTLAEFAMKLASHQDSYKRRRL